MARSEENRRQARAIIRTKDAIDPRLTDLSDLNHSSVTRALRWVKTSRPCCLKLSPAAYQKTNLVLDGADKERSFSVVQRSLVLFQTISISSHPQSSQDIRSWP